MLHKLRSYMDFLLLFLLFWLRSSRFLVHLYIFEIIEWPFLPIYQFKILYDWPLSLLIYIKNITKGPTDSKKIESTAYIIIGQNDIWTDILNKINIIRSWVKITQFKAVKPIDTVRFGLPFNNNNFPTVAQVYCANDFSITL